MRYLLIFFLFVTLQVKGQNQSSTTLFAQCLFEISSPSDLDSLQNEIRNLPFTTIVRLDAHSQRAFILTKGIEELSEEELRSWFGNYSSTVRCVQIGVKGVDEIKRYPFKDCE